MKVEPRHVANKFNESHHLWIRFLERIPGVTRDHNGARGVEIDAPKHRRPQLFAPLV